MIHFRLVFFGYFKKVIVNECDYQNLFIFSKMVVPKRAAMLLDRIMVALHHALEDNDNEGVQRITDLYKSNRHIANDARFQKETMHHLRGTEDDINIYGIPFDLNEKPGSNGIDIGQYSTDESVNMISMEFRNSIPWIQLPFQNM